MKIYGNNLPSGISRVRKSLMHALYEKFLIMDFMLINSN